MLKVLVQQKRTMDFQVLEKFDHLSLYYIYHFLGKKLRMETFDKEMKFQGKEVLLAEVKSLT